MIVCHCTAVNDRAIADAVAAGARDEFDVARACGAGSVCGTCVPAITRLLGRCPSAAADPQAAAGAEVAVGVDPPAGGIRLSLRPRPV